MWFAWLMDKRTFQTNVGNMLTKVSGPFASQFTAAQVPLAFWNAVPLDQLEAWIKAHVPAELASDISRGQEAARSRRWRRPPTARCRPSLGAWPSPRNKS